MNTALPAESAEFEALQEFECADELWRRASEAVEKLEAADRTGESMRLAVIERDAARLFRDEALRCLQAAEAEQAGRQL